MKNATRDADIRQRYTEGHSARKIATEYGLTRERVHQIVQPEAHLRVARRQNLLNNHGLEESTYNELLDAQGGVCAICGSSNPGRGTGGQRRKFSIDHCHSSLEIRGLLCSQCNLAIGMFKDRPELILAALAYLQAPGTGIQSRPRRGARQHFSPEQIAAFNAALRDVKAAAGTEP